MKYNILNGKVLDWISTNPQLTILVSAQLVFSKPHCGSVGYS